MSFAHPRSVLLIDDDDDFREALKERLELAGFAVTAFASGEAALDALSPDFPGIVITDLRMPLMDGRGVLSRVQALDDGLPVIMITGHGDISDAVEAIHRGAYDFVAKPFAFERLSESLNRGLEKRALVLDNRALAKLAAEVDPDLPLLGSSPAIVRLRTVISQISDAEMDVLIEGETGTGKEVVARALHAGGRRRIHPFVAVNCGALPDALIESELFGHEAGAFAGALRRRVGYVEQSHRGTLFLDEIESMPLSAQVKLLRVVEQREVQALGAAAPKVLNLRILASSKIDLAEAVEEGTFRGDLYYRLNVVKLRAPPLRERRDDIPLLFAHFQARASRANGLQPPPLSAAVRRKLLEHDWPGNVRELAHYAERVTMNLDTEIDTIIDDTPRSLSQRMDHLECEIIREALESHSGDVAALTHALQIPRKTLYDKFRKHGLRPGEFR